MTDQRELELISAAIDGELDADERAELDLLLESSAEARELNGELEKLDSLLKEVPDLEPSASLHARIMAQAKPRQVQSKSSMGNWAAILSPVAGFRYAVAVSAGALLVGIFIGIRSVPPDTIDVVDIVGTVAPESVPADANIVDSFAIREEGLESLVQLRLSGSDYFLDIDSDTTQRLDIFVDLGGAGLWPDAMAQTDGQSEAIAVAGQILRIEALGKQRLSVLLRHVDDVAVNGEAKITFEFSSEGKLLQRGSLTATLKGVRQ